MPGLWKGGKVSVLDLPERLGPYEVKGVLGVGGMGIVLDAKNAEGVDVALKLMRPVSDETVERASMLRKRFEREIEISQKIQHRNLARLIDFGFFEDDVPFLATERIDGFTLEAIRKTSPLTPVAIASIGAQIADALSHLHALGVVHRDVKPGNVMIDRSGRVVLTDFGLSRDLSNVALTRVGKIVGTTGFVAPEIIGGATQPTPAADQYSLGCLLFELAAVKPRQPDKARTPFGRMKEALEVDWSRFPKGSEWAPLEEPLRRMLEEKPEDRFGDAAECSAALAGLTFETSSKETSIDSPFDEKTAIDPALAASLAPPPDTLEAIIEVVAKVSDEQSRDIPTEVSAHPTLPPQPVVVDFDAIDDGSAQDVPLAVPVPELPIVADKDVLHDAYESLRRAPTKISKRKLVRKYRRNVVGVGLAIAALLTWGGFILFERAAPKPPPFAMTATDGPEEWEVEFALDLYRLALISLEHGDVQHARVLIEMCIQTANLDQCRAKWIEVR